MVGNRWLVFLVLAFGVFVLWLLLSGKPQYALTAKQSIDFAQKLETLLGWNEPVLVIPFDSYNDVQALSYLRIATYNRPLSDEKFRRIGFRLRGGVWHRGVQGTLQEHLIWERLAESAAVVTLAVSDGPKQEEAVIQRLQRMHKRVADRIRRSCFTVQ